MTTPQNSTAAVGGRGGANTRVTASMIEIPWSADKPHPACRRPGPQPANQIAPTAEEQLLRAMQGRRAAIEPLPEGFVRRLVLTLRTDALCVRSLRRLVRRHAQAAVRRVLLDELPELIDYCLDRRRGR